MTRVDPAFRRQLEGASLLTAEILYRMPDARELLQTFIWQDYDVAPRFPRLLEFLEFWTRELDGPLHSVRVCHASLVGPRDFRYANAELVIH